MISRIGMAQFAAARRGIFIGLTFSFALLSAHGAAPGRLPSFSLPDLDGKVWNSTQFEGQALVVDFWATWCATCKETVPKLAELSEKYKGQGLTVLGISVDKGSAEKIRKSAGKLGINYLVLLDQDNTLAPSFGFSGIPSLYIFDRQGNLEAAMPGYDPEQEKQLSSATEKALRTPMVVAVVTKTRVGASATSVSRTKTLKSKSKSKIKTKTITKRKGY